MNPRSSLRSTLAIGLPVAGAIGLGVAVLYTVSRTSADDAVTIKPLPVSVALLEGEKKAEEKAETKKPVELPKGTGILKGRITYQGDAPSRPPIVKRGDASVKDSAVCAAEDIPDETLLVNAQNKGIANVAVYLLKLPAGFKAPKPPTEPVIFDQKGCRFVPRMLAVQVGQKVVVKSGDPIAHNTHTTPLRAREFNSAIGANDRVGVPLTYDKTERLPVKVKCDLHGWMFAYHVVTDHPYAAVTNENGEYEISGIPAGKHSFVVWHELPGHLERKGTVIGKEAEIKDGATTEMSVEYGEDKFKVK